MVSKLIAAARLQPTTPWSDISQYFKFHSIDSIKAAGANVESSESRFLLQVGLSCNFLLTGLFFEYGGVVTTDVLPECTTYRYIGMKVVPGNLNEIVLVGLGQGDDLNSATFQIIEVNAVMEARTLSGELPSLLKDTSAILKSLVATLNGPRSVRSSKRVAESKKKEQEREKEQEKEREREREREQEKEQERERERERKQEETEQERKRKKEQEEERERGKKRQQKELGRKNKQTNRRSLSPVSWQGDSSSNTDGMEEASKTPRQQKYAREKAKVIAARQRENQLQAKQNQSIEELSKKLGESVVMGIKGLNQHLKAMKDETSSSTKVEIEAAIAQTKYESIQARFLHEQEALKAERVAYEEEHKKPNEAERKTISWGRT
jgi:hypothetical protein